MKPFERIRRLSTSPLSGVLVHNLIIFAASALVFLLTFASPAEDSVATCDAEAERIVSLIDVDTADELGNLFGDNIAGTPGFFRTWLTVVLREWGHPDDTTSSEEYDPADYTELGMRSRGLKEPFTQYKFRTTFHLEGSGVIHFELTSPQSECHVQSLVFSVARTRPDALTRYYETTKQIDEALGALFR